MRWFSRSWGRGAQPLNLENDQNDELTNHVSAMLLAAGSTCENPNALWNSASLSSFSRREWDLLYQMVTWKPS